MINEIICIGTSFMEGHGLNPNQHYAADNPAVNWYDKNKGITISDN